MIMVVIFVSLIKQIGDSKRFKGVQRGSKGFKEIQRVSKGFKEMIGWVEARGGGILAQRKKNSLKFLNRKSILFLFLLLIKVKMFLFIRKDRFFL